MTEQPQTPESYIVAYAEIGQQGELYLDAPQVFRDYSRARAAALATLHRNMRMDCGDEAAMAERGLPTLAALEAEHPDDGMDFQAGYIGGDYEWTVRLTAV